MITLAEIKQVENNSPTTRYRVWVKVNGGDPDSEDIWEIGNICTLPNTYMNLKVGDKVYIGFNENNRDQPIILGVLPTQKHTSFPSTTLDSLIVNNDTKLSSTTEIGRVKSKEIQYLEGLSSNAQGQLNRLEDMCNNIVKISVQGNSLVITDIKERIN